ncbi:MAG: hypothetical protein HDR06_15950 [Lachnospiraceae bacterium]|nr:hypothetical protein [Lachnospiraceae bacterium]
MMTTDLTVKESDLRIKYGPYYRGKEVNIQNLATVKYMYTDLTDIRKYYIRLGFHLCEFRVNAGYMDFGYLTLEDFCDVNLGLDKSAVSRCINVYREFNARNDQENIRGLEKHGCAMDLSDKWKDYSYTQLCEMLPLSPEDRKNVLPSMSCKEIREFKKQLKDRKKKSLNGAVASTQPEESGSGSVASTQPKIFSYEEYVRKNSGIIEQNYIKSCDSLDSIVVHVFDSRGRKVLCNYWADLLERPTGKNNNRLVIRMCSNFTPAVIALDAQPDQKGDHNE